MTTERLFILTLLLISCATYTTSSTQGGEFFFCNEWVDNNQDGKIGSSEWVGIKDEFRVGLDETITMVGYFRSKRGMIWKIAVIEPRGDLVYLDTGTVVYDNQISRRSFQVRTLYDRYGVGVWTAKWYLEDNLVYRRNFEILR